MVLWEWKVGRITTIDKTHDFSTPKKSDELMGTLKSCKHLTG